MSQLKKLVNDKTLWDSYCDYIKGRIDKSRKSLETANDEVEVRRHQGSIRELRRLLQMRDEINGATDND